MTFAQDCCDREAMSWAATTGGYSGDVVRDVMLAAVENRFGNVRKAPAEIEWPTDNGSGYTADKTRNFAASIGLKPLMPVCSPQSKWNGGKLREDDEARVRRPHAEAGRGHAARNLAIAFEH